MSLGATTVDGRLVLDDRVAPGRLVIRDGLIVEVQPLVGSQASSAGPIVAPGFVDVHVHGGGGHDAMRGAAALDGMARYLLRHGITSFLPTAVTAQLPALTTFAEDVRAWLPGAPGDGAEPLGFNLEGPFLAPSRRGAHDPAHLRVPADIARADLEPLLDGLRLMTIAPELPGALDLIGWLRERGVATSIGHSAATLDEARAGFRAGGTSTTHLFNAMTEPASVVAPTSVTRCPTTSTSRPPIVVRPSPMPASEIASLTSISRSAGFVRVMIGQSDGWTCRPSAINST
jgi:N-acetylglucosamine-6-phosphate deacetylase